MVGYYIFDFAVLEDLQIIQEGRCCCVSLNGYDENEMKEWVRREELKKPEANVEISNVEEISKETYRAMTDNMV